MILHMHIKQIFLVSLLLLLCCLVPAGFVCFAADEDPCNDQGITVKNLSSKEIWYKRKDGACAILKENYFFVIKPQEEIRLFSDLVCETQYCPACTYADYKSYDADGNCRVRILPGNTLSDM
jgi:hypothetical protein